MVVDLDTVEFFCTLHLKYNVLHKVLNRFRLAYNPFSIVDHSLIPFLITPFSLRHDLYIILFFVKTSFKSYLVGFKINPIQGTKL
jgi:hypothetical protein